MGEASSADGAGAVETFRVSAPKATGDSFPGDRVVILEFSQAVPVEEIEAIFQEGVDSDRIPPGRIAHLPDR